MRPARFYGQSLFFQINFLVQFLYTVFVFGNRRMPLVDSLELLLMTLAVKSSHSEDKVKI